MLPSSAVQRPMSWIHGKVHIDQYHVVHGCCCDGYVPEQVKGEAIARAAIPTILDHGKDDLVGMWYGSTIESKELGSCSSLNFEIVSEVSH